MKLEGRRAKLPCKLALQGHQQSKTELSGTKQLRVVVLPFQVTSQKSIYGATLIILWQKKKNSYLFSNYSIFQIITMKTVLKNYFIDFIYERAKHKTIRANLVPVMAQSKQVGCWCFQTEWVRREQMITEDPLLLTPNYIKKSCFSYSFPLIMKEDQLLQKQVRSNHLLGSKIRLTSYR